jgi:hypothetical protein
MILRLSIAQVRERQHQFDDDDDDNDDNDIMLPIYSREPHCELRLNCEYILQSWWLNDSFDLQ